MISFLLDLTSLYLLFCLITHNLSSNNMTITSVAICKYQLSEICESIDFSYKIEFFSSFNFWYELLVYIDT